jgi:putative NADH-flavin reductase
LEVFLLRVAIIGASGRVGRAATARALTGGNEVVAVVRTATSAPPGTEVKVADARDVAALSSALEGVDAVVSCLGHVAGADDPDVLRDGIIALISAMSARRVSRLVAVSAAGAYVAGDDPLSRFIAKPLVAKFFGQAFADTRQMEDAIRGSDANWTILRPSRLVPGSITASYRFGVDRAVKWHYSTTFNTVGRAAIDSLANDAWVGHAVFITE